MHLQQICLLEMAHEVTSTPRNTDLISLKCFSDAIENSELTGQISPTGSLDEEVCINIQSKVIENTNDIIQNQQHVAIRLLNSEWDDLSYKEKQTMDIAQKGIVRAIRRFFSKIFLSQNKVIQNKRIKNVYYKDALRSMKKLVVKMFPHYHDIQGLSEFMIKFCSLKLK
jgi:hypothetical protein